MSKKHVRLLSVLGTRPEAIKMAPILHALREDGVLESTVCLTGQHEGTPEAILSHFGILPDIRLSLMRKHDTLSALSSRLLSELDEVIELSLPDAVLVHGDTASACFASLAAFYRHIPVLHVEAGLRSGDAFEPFPEEVYRRTVDAVSSLCLAPTERAAEALRHEGHAESEIAVTGNSGLDALRFTLSPTFSHPLLDACKGKRPILLTLHRRENQGEAYEGVLRAVRRAIEERETGAHLLCITHPNPHLATRARAVLLGAAGVSVTPPLEPFVLHNLLSRAALLLTDSGGLIEEATFLGIPTLVLRRVSERCEGEALRVVGNEEEAVYRALSLALDAPRSVRPSCIYGDGHAAERILFHIKKYFAVS